MRKSVDFFFDVGSPSSYLAWTQLPRLCASHGADLVYRPMLLGGVYQATGNASPANIPVKGRYTQMDYERHARRYGVPFQGNPHFPVITLFLMRAVTGIQLRRPEQLQQLLGCVFKALWIDALNLNDAQLTARTLAEGGLAESDVAKLYIYYYADGGWAEIARTRETIARVQREFYGEAGPAVTAVRVSGFAFEDLLIEIEAFAVCRD